jgi:DNA replication protein DnaC
MSQATMLLLEQNLRTLKLPAVLKEYARLAREAASGNRGYEDYLEKLTELEVSQRSSNAITNRIRAADYPVLKDLESFDFTLTPSLNQQKVLELARGEWIREHYNCCLIGNSGTGKTHLAIALGQAACRHGRHVRFHTAASLVNQLEEAQKQYRLEKLLSALERVDLLIVDELGYLSLSASGAELLFQVFAERYERRSILITSNLPFGEWGGVFKSERLTAALLDRLTHRCHILECNGESYRFRQSSQGVRRAQKRELTAS